MRMTFLRDSVFLLYDCMTNEFEVELMELLRWTIVVNVRNSSQDSIEYFSKSPHQLL